MAATTFHYFPRLPAELKVEIWRQFLRNESQYRAVRLDERSLRVLPTKDLCSASLSVDRLSRETAKKFYSVQVSVLGFLDNKERPSVGKRWSRRAMRFTLLQIRDEACSTRGVISFNPKLDTFCLCPWDRVVTGMLKAKTRRARPGLIGTKKQRCMISTPLPDNVCDTIQNLVVYNGCSYVRGGLPFHALPSDQHRFIWEIFKNARYFFHLVVSDENGRPLQRGNVRLASGHVGVMTRCHKIEAANFLGRRVGPGVISLSLLAALFVRTYPDVGQRRRHWSALQWSHPEDLVGYAPQWMKQEEETK